MQNELQQLIKQINDGYGQDTGIPDPEIKCGICNDYGWVVLDVDINHPDFGKSFPCKCVLEDLRRYRWDHCGIPSDHLHETFELFEQNRSMEAFSAAKDLTDGKINLLVLCGDTGAGKTHLAHSIIINTIQNDIAAMLIRAMDWLDDMKSAIRHDIAVKNAGGVSCESDTMRSHAIRIPVLAIDELKWRTHYDEEVIDDLITRRMVEEKQTVITSNSTIDELWGTFRRVMSRASDPRFGRAIWIDVPDYRQELQKKSAPSKKASLRVTA